MDEFLATHEWPKLTEENLNTPITSKEFEWVIKNLPTKKSPVPDGSTNRLHQTFYEELTPILLKPFQKIEEGMLPNSSYEAFITLIPKPDKHIPSKENYRSIYLIDIDAKILNNI